MTREERIAEYNRIKAIDPKSIVDALVNDGWTKTTIIKKETKRDNEGDFVTTTFVYPVFKKMVNRFSKFVELILGTSDISTLGLENMSQFESTVMTTKLSLEDIRKVINFEPKVNVIDIDGISSDDMYVSVNKI